MISMNDGKTGKQQFLYYAAIMLASAILLSNMFYGFTWTDEGLYLSDVHRFFSGDRFLIDNWTSTQLYGPLLLPIYTLFVKVKGSTEGVYLFFRILTIVFQTIVTLFSYSVLSKKYNKTESLFVSLLFLAFSRACINGPSYYTISLETYTFGIMCLYAVFVLSYRRIFLFFSGFFFACSILCNPFLVIPYIIVSIFCLFFKKSRSHLKDIILIWIGTIALAIIYLAYVFKGNTISEVLQGFQATYNDPDYEHNFIKMIKRMSKMPRSLILPYIFTWIPMFIVCAVIKIKKISLTEKSSFILHLINTIVFIGNCFYKQDCGVSVMCFFHYTIFTAFIFSNFKIVDIWKENYKELLFFVLPGLILAFFSEFASDTRFGVCAIGMTLSAVGEVFIYSRYIEKYLPTIKNKLNKLVKIFPILILFVFTFIYRINLIYRDAQLSPHLFFIPGLHKNITRIDRGPAKGIYTYSEYKPFYDDLYELMEQLNNTNSEKNLFISGVATWAYVAFPNIRCAAPTTWRCRFGDIRFQSYFEIFPKHPFPDYILVLNKDNPSNYDDEKRYDSWLYKEMEKHGFTEEMTKNGVLYRIYN